MTFLGGNFIIMNTSIDKTNSIKWFLIVSSGLIILAYLSIILYFPIFLESDYDYGVPMVFIVIIFFLIEPIAFYIVLFNFYQSYFHLILWEIWLIPWVVILRQTHTKHDIWDQKKQISSYIILVIIVLVSAATLQFFYPTDDIISKLAAQVYWIVPLWLLVWTYGWIIDIPQTLISFKRISILQVIWVCLFVILSVMAIFYVGTLMLERVVFPID
ncbi:MAG: hypothetical protein ACXADY_07875 [Candidatus Hodarchaeales archaeon]|jgi:hypothetical protein